jgi:4'-phosphopantetheinyl transferase
MIYRAILREDLPEPIAHKAHIAGEQLLAYGLFIEKGIIYKNELVIYNQWGKPSLKNYPNIQYNISHCQNCIACVICDTHAVGIDVEKVRMLNSYAAKRVCSTEELQRIYSGDDPNREFFRYWTLKESYIKAIGMGLSFPMRNVNFEIQSDGSIHSSFAECSFFLLEDIKDFITAVCYKM